MISGPKHENCMQMNWCFFFWKFDPNFSFLSKHAEMLTKTIDNNNFVA